MAERKLDEQPAIRPEDREKYRGNNAKKTPVQQVASGSLVTPSMGERVLKAFFADAKGTITDYLIFDILIPSTKDFIATALKNGVDAIFYGKAKPRSDGPRTSYGSYYGRQPARREEPERKKEDALRFGIAQDAYDILDKMEELIEVYGEVTVADLCDLAGVTSDFTDNKYGWKSLRNARVVRDTNGWYLDIGRSRVLE